MLLWPHFLVAHRTISVALRCVVTSFSTLDALANVPLGVQPNEKKAANDFNNALALHQVKYLGLLENVRIRRAGYAYRQLYDKFFYRYRVVCPKTWSGWSGDMVAGAFLFLSKITLPG